MRSIRELKNHIPAHLLFACVREREEAVFLDSSLTGELGQFSIIACRPYLKLEDFGDYFTVNSEVQGGSFISYVKAYLKENQEENGTHLPIVSGAVGYFSYEFGRKKEKVVSRHEKLLDIPDSILYFYDIFIIEDHRTEKVYLVANGKLKDPEESVEELERQFALLKKQSGDKLDEIHSCSIQADFSKDDYMSAVDDMIRYIVDGDIYVVNMTQQLQISGTCDPYTMFCRLRQNNPSPFGGYFDYNDFQIVCASPERFMKMTDRNIKTRPIKGTRKRGATPEEDEHLKNELACSEKDQSELLMIVDLERNDLNRVCDPGSVVVTELFKVETYATVFHLVSNIEGRLADRYNTMDLIEAAFPGGSVTGAPKLRAMELIDQEERSRRNLYAGSIGYIALNGDCDLNIVIRTAIYKDGVYHLGAGGGITYESDLEFEYEETWQKANALLQALGAKAVDGETYEYSIR